MEFTNRDTSITSSGDSTSTTDTSSENVDSGTAQTSEEKEVVYTLT